MWKPIALAVCTLLAPLTVIMPAAAQDKGRKAEPSQALSAIDPAVRRFVIALWKDDFDADAEKRDPTYIATAPLALADGRKAVVVVPTRSWICSPTGNCPLLVLTPRGHGFKVIGLFFGHTPVRVLPHTTNGYPDLTAWGHGSAFDNIESRYRFNGKRYVMAGRRNGWVSAYRNNESTSRKLLSVPEGRLLIGNETGELLYK